MIKIGILKCDNNLHNDFFTLSITEIYTMYIKIEKVRKMRQIYSISNNNIFLFIFIMNNK